MVHAHLVAELDARQLAADPHFQTTPRLAWVLVTIVNRSPDMVAWWIRGYRTRLLSDEDVREELNRVDTHSYIGLTRALAQAA